jgi:hypothetical protein
MGVDHIGTGNRIGQFPLCTLSEPVAQQGGLETPMRDPLGSGKTRK